MGERGVIERTVRPATASSLTADLRGLGLSRGATVMVHSSLSKLGYVVGGAQAVVEALFDVVGDTGTVAMPTHSGALSDPASWIDPPVPEAWWDEIRDAMPAFDENRTPTRSMGSIVECFRSLRGVVRSAHPTVSAAAFGPDADHIVAGHELAHGLGETSPQARLYDLDAEVLLLGVTHANDTALHLAEYRSAWSQGRTVVHGSPVSVDGERRWVTYEALDDHDGDFERIGDAFAETGRERTAPVGAGTARLCRVREIVDFAADWIDRHRPSDP